MLDGNQVLTGKPYEERDLYRFYGGRLDILLSADSFRLRKSLMKRSLAIITPRCCPAAALFRRWAADTTMGFIYVGPKDDYGYNQAHAEGKAGVSKLPGVKTVEEANVPENGRWCKRR